VSQCGCAAQARGDLGHERRRQREESVDVLIVTAVKEEWDAILAVETGAAPGSQWKTRRDSTGAYVAERDFTAGGGVLRVAVVQGFGMGRELAVIAAAPLLERHPEIRCLAMCGVCATLKLWDVAIGRLVRSFRGHQGWVLSVAFSPEGRLALRGSRDNTLSLWDSSTGRNVGTFTGDAGFSCVAWDAYSSRVMAGDVLGRVHLFAVRAT
jgi:hypothetical protein